MPYLTNENAFETRERPKHLIVLGGGPVGLELAQAFRRLGSEVTVLEQAQPLGKEDPECAAIVLDAFAREGVTMRSGVKVERVAPAAASGSRSCWPATTGETIQGTDLLVATGRRPNIDALDLQAAGIEHEPRRHRGRQTLRAPATGASMPSATSPALPAFTHSANHQAGLLIRHAAVSPAGQDRTSTTFRA